MTNAHTSRIARRLVLVTCTVVATAMTGCGGGNAKVPDTIIAVEQPPVATPAAKGGHRGGRGSGGGAQATAALPAGWPADVPAPPGSIQGSTHANPTTWTVQTLASGSAQAVMSQAVANYRSAGFRAESDATLHNATHRVTIVVENRDHSNTETFVVVAVTGR